VSEFSTFFCVVVSNPQKVGHCLHRSRSLSVAVSLATIAYTKRYTTKRGERDSDKAWVTNLILNSKFWPGVKIEFVTGIIRAEGPFAPRPALDAVRRRPSRCAEHANNLSCRCSQECCDCSRASSSEGPVSSSHRSTTTTLIPYHHDRFEGQLLKFDRSVNVVALPPAQRRSFRWSIMKNNIGAVGCSSILVTVLLPLLLLPFLSWLPFYCSRTTSCRHFQYEPFPPWRDWIRAIGPNRSANRPTSPVQR
jgi:hypothetical protein